MTKSTGDDKIIQEAKDRFKRAEEYERPSRDKARLDTMFANGDARNGWQWQDNVLLSRQQEDRPCLTANKTQQHNFMIVNDALENKSSPKVSPIGDGASYEAAQIFNGLFRHIENQSNAQDAYSKAINDQVTGGLGWARVTTNYASDQVGIVSFNQDLFIKRVIDPFSIYLDPDAQEADKSDSRFGFVFNDLARDEAEEKFPWLKDSGVPLAALDHGDGWDTKDHVREAEYFRRVEKADRILMLPNNDVVLESGLDEDTLAMLTQDGAQELQSRDIKIPVIEWYKIIGGKIVERELKTVWAYIPLVPFTGIETIIDKKLDRRGHTRSVLDSQRMYNFWISAQAESAGYQTNIPWIVPAEGVEGYETEWANANRSTKAYLPYNHVGEDGVTPIPRPERINPPVPSQAALAGQQTALNDMMIVTGQYEAEMGAPGNEKSGRAINERQRQSDRATYHFVDHAAQAMRLVAKILLSAIPKVYDTPRVLRILDEDGTENHVVLDPNAQLAHQPMQGPVPPQVQQMMSPGQKVQAIFNPTVGRYCVVADVGPSFATKRQDAFNAFSQIMQASPDLMKIAGDLLFKAADFPFADQLAERLQRAIPPQLLGDGPDPQIQQLQQQLMQQKQLMGHMMQQVADAEQKLKDKNADISRQDYEAETKRLAAVGAVDPAALKPIIREMVSSVLGIPAVPVMAAHADAEQAMQPPTDDNGADQQQGAAA